MQRVRRNVMLWQFLSGLAQVQPDWSLLARPHAAELPAHRWKLANIQTFKERLPEDFEGQAKKLDELLKLPCSWCSPGSGFLFASNDRQLKADLGRWTTGLQVTAVPEAVERCGTAWPAASSLEPAFGPDACIRAGRATAIASRDRRRSTRCCHSRSRRKPAALANLVLA